MHMIVHIKYTGSSIIINVFLYLSMFVLKQPTAYLNTVVSITVE